MDESTQSLSIMSLINSFGPGDTKTVCLGTIPKRSTEPPVYGQVFREDRPRSADLDGVDLVSQSAAVHQQRVFVGVGLRIDHWQGLNGLRRQSRRARRELVDLIAVAPRLLLALHSVHEGRLAIRAQARVARQHLGGGRSGTGAGHEFAAAPAHTALDGRQLLLAPLSLSQRYEAPSRMVH